MYSILDSAIRFDQLVRATFLGDRLQGARSNQVSTKRMLVLFLFVSPLYGAAMGSYSWVAGRREISEQWIQMIFSGLKMPLLIVASAMIALPSFYVFNRLLGLAEDFPIAIESIIRSWAGFAITIASLSPVTMFFYFGIGHYSPSYQWAVLLNATVFGIAVICSQWILSKSYKILIQKNGRHRWGMRVWGVTFVFVGIQAGWSLRPFIGSPHMEITFFRDEPFSNAYLAIIKVIRVSLG